MYMSITYFNYMFDLLECKLSSTKFYRYTYIVSFFAVVLVPKTIPFTWFAIVKESLKE